MPPKRSKPKAALSHWRARTTRRNKGRYIPRNKLSTSVTGPQNKIQTIRTLDYGIINLADDKKAYSAAIGAHSCAPFNFPNFDITMMPNYSEWGAMFGRYRVTAIEIRLVPCYSYQQVLLQNTDIAGSFPGNTVSNLLITRLSTKYDTSPNEDRFDATYGKDDIEQLDQFVKKKTVVIPTKNFKGLKCYTRNPRQVQPVIKSISSESTVLENVPGKFNDFDAGGIQYVANDSIYIRNADLERGLPTGILRCRVIYKVWLELAGFQ